jgi:hypothetical protein
LDFSFAGFGVGVGLVVGPGVGLTVGFGVGAVVGVAAGVGVGTAVGWTTGGVLGVGVGRTTTTTPGDVGVGEGSVVGETLGAGEGDGDGPISTEGAGVPLAVGSDGTAGVVVGSVDPGWFEGPPAIPSPSIGLETPTASANVARTRFRRPRATTSRARWAAVVTSLTSPSDGFDGRSP